MPYDIVLSSARASLLPDLVPLVQFEGGLHVQSWNLEPTRYAAEVQAFVARVRG